jgi:DNA modification methylase
MTPIVTIMHGDAGDQLPKLFAEMFQMCVTSPPYYKQRSYLMDLQSGLEGA